VTTERGSSRRPPQSSELGSGVVIAGKYRIERELGTGGMGVVLAARHVDLNQLVAIKFLHPGTAHQPEVASRFIREARAAVSVHSEHVARVLDVSKLDDGRPYMVMEYLEGRDLSQVIAGGPLPVPRAVEYVLHACAGMAAAHRLGIVHRDLKPANLFLTQVSDEWAIVKVLDFGISKNALDRSAATLTSTSALVGSPLYMSPEQMTSARHVDLRTDIWSLGAVLFELLSGATPFSGDSLAGLAAAILMQEPASLRDLRPEVPVELEAVILRALRKQPSERFQNVLELACALEPFAAPEALLALERVKRTFGSLPPPSLPRAPLSLPTPSALAPGATATTWTESANPPAASRWLPPKRWLATVGLLGVVGASVFALLRAGAAVDRKAPTGTALPSMASTSSTAPHWETETAPVTSAPEASSEPAARPSADAARSGSPPRTAPLPATNARLLTTSSARPHPPPPSPAPTRHPMKNPLDVQLK
jgi:eukaryotic-like serine/threonine-protein kinase